MSRPRSRGNGEGSIYPYRGGYAAHVWVTTTDGEKRRRYVYGKTYEETQGKWFDLQAKARAGPLPAKVPKLADYLQYWLAQIVKPSLAPLTYHTYETFVRLYITPGLGSKRVDRLQVRDVQTWLNSLATTCQCCAQGKDARRPVAKQRCCAKGQCCNGHVSTRTIRDIRGCLRAALSTAKTEELIGRNVAALVRLPKQRRTRRKAWSSDEARRFLEYARAVRDPLYAAYVLILVLGLRKGEVLGLEWSDVDLDTAELRPGLQLQRVGRRLLHRETKTEASDAPLPLPEICVTALCGRRTLQDTARRDAGDAWQNYGLIFTTRLGTPIEPRNFNRTWDKRVQDAAVRTITVHDARRTCGSLLVDLDVHPRVAMEVLRHTDFDVTMEIYAQVTSPATRDALKRLGESLDG